MSYFIKYLKKFQVIIFLLNIIYLENEYAIYLDINLIRILTYINII